MFRKRATLFLILTIELLKIADEDNLIFVTLEIIEGNKRAIMRLILALAAHFKPGSVRPANNDAPSGRLERASSTMSLAAEAAVALADASQLASSAGLSLHYKYK